MNKVIWVVVCAILLYAKSAHTHQPDQIRLKYFPDGKRLSVAIDHHVHEKYKHYIDQITVRVNNGGQQRYYLSGQDSTGLVLKEVKVNARKGDTIHVSAHCNIQGSLEAFINLLPEHYYDVGGHYRTFKERPDYRGFYRTIENHRYHRFHSHEKHLKDKTNTEQTTAPQTPQNPVDTPQRRHLELEQEIRRSFHKTLEGGS